MEDTFKKMYNILYENLQNNKTYLHKIFLIVTLCFCESDICNVVVIYRYISYMTIAVISIPTEFTVHMVNIRFHMFSD